MGGFSIARRRWLAWSLLALAAAHVGLAVYLLILDTPVGFDRSCWGPVQFVNEEARSRLEVGYRTEDLGVVFVPSLCQIALTPETWQAGRPVGFGLILGGYRSADQGGLNLDVGTPPVPIRLRAGGAPDGRFELSLPPAFTSTGEWTVPRSGSIPEAIPHRRFAASWIGGRLHCQDGRTQYSVEVPPSWKLDRLVLSSTDVTQQILTVWTRTFRGTSPRAGFEIHQETFEPSWTSPYAQALVILGAWVTLTLLGGCLRAVGRRVVRWQARWSGDAPPTPAEREDARLHLACVLGLAGLAGALTLGNPPALSPLRSLLTAAGGLVLGLGGLAVAYRAWIVSAPPEPPRIEQNPESTRLRVWLLWTLPAAIGLAFVWALPHRDSRASDVLSLVSWLTAAIFPFVLRSGGPHRCPTGLVFSWLLVPPLALGQFVYSSASWVFSPERAVPLVLGAAVACLLIGLVLVLHREFLCPVVPLFLGPLLLLTLTGEVYTKQVIGPVMLVGGYFPYSCWMDPEGVDDPTSKRHMRPFRGRPPGPSRAGLLRVMVLGGSVTYGQGLSEQDDAADYCHVMQEELQRQLPGREVEVLNCGAPGFTTELGLEVFRERLLPLEPDLVIVSYGLNDNPSPWTGKGRDRRFVEQERRVARSALAPVRRALRRSGLYLMLARCLITGDILQTPTIRFGLVFGPNSTDLSPRVSTQEYVENLEAFAELARRHGFRLALTSDVLTSDLDTAGGSSGERVWEGDRVRLAQEVGRKHHVPWLDLRRAHVSSSGAISEAFVDAAHMNGLGHRRVGLELARQVMALGLTPVAAGPAEPAGSR